jgi:hypothetical protein
MRVLMRNQLSEKRLLTILVGIGVLGLVSALQWFARHAPRRQETPLPGSDDPRLSFATPYLNVQPDVGYVGDRVCADCHPAIAGTFHLHPMGRSLAPVSTVAGTQRYDAEAHNPFEIAGARYRVERRDGRVWHEEVHLDHAGRELTRTTEEVQYVIGSGARTYSYLIEHDGSLFESPITWFSQKHFWNLSPGFETRTERFGRVVTAECLFCHTNRAAYRENTLNGYQRPIFQGYAVGCERCHGPGQLHVQRRERGEVVADAEDTIVNPARLEPALRDAVCQQCHLEGESRVLRRGRQPFDFRPGLPLRLFWTVFVKPHESDDRLVGNFEQLYTSRCYQASGGKLGCISCHDPHVWPATETKVAYYRSRCLQCHEETSCTAPADQRHATAGGDNCIGCHMPRLDSSDVMHVAISDHRIPRRPGAAQRPPAESEDLPSAGSLPLVLFPQEPVDTKDADTTRDLGVAMTTLATFAPESSKAVCLITLPYLERAVKQWPDDLRGRDALTYALSIQGRNEEALTVCEGTLAQVPDRESSLELAARLAKYLGDPEGALAYWRRAAAVGPWTSVYRIQAARILAEQGRWPNVRDECQLILRYSPAQVPARLLLAAAYAHTGKTGQARAERRIAEGLDPGRRDALWSWLNDSRLSNR